MSSLSSRHTLKLKFVIYHRSLSWVSSVLPLEQPLHLQLWLKNHFPRHLFKHSENPSLGKQQSQLSWSKVTKLPKLVFLLLSSGRQVENCVTFSQWFSHKTAAFHTEQCMTPSFFHKSEVSQDAWSHPLRNYGFIFNTIFFICTHARTKHDYFKMTELEVHSVYTVEPRLVVTLLAQSPALIWSARRVRIIAHYVLYITISIMRSPQ